MNPVCDNCEELITGAPFYFDGKAYCCAGCAGGGPCTCTYQAPASDLDPVFASDAESPELIAPPSEQPDLTTSSAVTEEIPPVAARERPSRPAIVRVGGFNAQIELLQFALELEQQPSIEDVALVRSDLDDAWFEIRVANVEQLELALEGLTGFAVAVEPATMSLEATVYPAARPDTEPAEAEISELLPPRPRFRLYGRPEESATLEPDAGQVVAALEGAVVQAAAETATGAIAPGARPGGAAPLREHVTLVVYPFRSFVVLNQFQEAVRGLHGIIDAKVRRFYKGTLHLAVDYEDIIPLAKRIDDLEGFEWQVVSESANELEMMLSEEAELTPAGAGA